MGHLVSNFSTFFPLVKPRIPSIVAYLSISRVITLLLFPTDYTKKLTKKTTWNLSFPSLLKVTETGMTVTDLIYISLSLIWRQILGGLLSMTNILL